MRVTQVIYEQPLDKYTHTNSTCDFITRAKKSMKKKIFCVSFFPRDVRYFPNREIETLFFLSILTHTNMYTHYRSQCVRAKQFIAFVTILRCVLII